MTIRRHRQRRVMRRFLHLAAIAFALGAEVPPATAGDEDAAPLSSEQRDDGARSDDNGAADAGEPVYRHVFPLRAMADGRWDGGTRARIRVIDADGCDQAQLALHGASMIGPLAPGAYTVLVESEGLTEIQRVRIDPGTLPYLHFTGLA